MASRSVMDKPQWKHHVTTDEVEEVFGHSPRYRFSKEEMLMEKSKKERDPIPEQFKSIEEAAEFWDRLGGLLGLDEQSGPRSRYSASAFF